MTDYGFTHDDNRQGKHFACQQCEYDGNADYKGTKHFGSRYARKRTQPPFLAHVGGVGDTVVDMRVNRGTLDDRRHRPVSGD